MKRSAWKILALVFPVHLVLVLLMCWSIYHSIATEGATYTGEASLGWQIFLAIDFPASIPVWPV